MIAKLTGRLDGVVEGGCVLDVNGVGYLVNCSTRTASALPPAPERAVLLIETQARENAISLYGFADERERGAFRALTRIQGVGPSVALAILSASEANLEAIDGMDEADRADPIRFQAEYHRRRGAIAERNRRARRRAPRPS